jgi:predicted Zn-dependent protease
VRLPIRRSIIQQLLRPLWLLAIALMLHGQSTTFQEQLQAAEQLFHRGDLAAANQAFLALARTHASEPQPQWYLGLIAYQQSRYQDARDRFRQLVERQEDMGPGWAMLGLTEFRMRDFDEALPHLELGRYLGIANQDTLAQAAALHQAFLCNRIQRFDVALAVLSELAVKGKKTPAIVAAFGVAALNRPWLLEDVPSHEQALVMEAGETAWLLGARRQQEAAARAEALVVRYPEQSGLQFILGTTLARADWPRAETALRKEVAANPNHYYAHVTLASELIDRGRPEEAASFCEKAVQLQPESYVARGLLGKALLSTGRADQAVAELEAAVQLAPTNANVRYSLALAYTRVGRKAEAAAQREIFTQLQEKQTAGGKPVDSQAKP